MPDIDSARLYFDRRYRFRALRQAGASMCILVSPNSLRYAVNFRSFGLFQSHFPVVYLRAVVGPIVSHVVRRASQITADCRS